MKTLKQIIKQSPVYLHGWEKDGKIGVISEFNQLYISKKEYETTEAPYPNVESWLERKYLVDKYLKEWKDINILFASYGQDNYSGAAFVLFEQGGKLYEVNAWHCSCYGLEGQWTPEETNIEALKHRLLNGNMGRDSYSGNEYANELINFLGIN